MLFFAYLDLTKFGERRAEVPDSLNSKSWELMGYWWFSCEVVQILVTTMVTDGSYVEGQA